MSSFRADSSWFTNLSFSSRFYHYRIWALIKEENALVMLFESLVTARDEARKIGNNVHDPGLATLLVSVRVPLSIEFRKIIEGIGIFIWLCKPVYDAVYSYVAFKTADEILWSEDSSIGWFLYSCHSLDVSTVSAFERVSNKWTLSKAHYVVEAYIEFRAPVRTGHVLCQPLVPSISSRNGLPRCTAELTMAVTGAKVGPTVSRREFGDILCRTIFHGQTLMMWNLPFLKAFS